MARTTAPLLETFSGHLVVQLVFSYVAIPWRIPSQRFLETILLSASYIAVRTIYRREKKKNRTNRDEKLPRLSGIY